MPDETKFVLEFIADQQYAIYPDRLNSLGPHECDVLCAQGKLFFCPRDLISEIKTYRGMGDGSLITV